MGLRPNLILWTPFLYALLLLGTDTLYHPLKISSQGVHIGEYMTNLVAKTFGFTPTFRKLSFFVFLSEHLSEMGDDRPFVCNAPGCGQVCVFGRERRLPVTKPTFCQWLHTRFGVLVVDSYETSSTTIDGSWAARLIAAPVKRPGARLS